MKTRRLAPSGPKACRTRWLCLVMGAVLALTSLQMAVARGQARIAGEIVICTGTGLSTVRVDAQGNPAGPAHICPDMVLGLMAALATPAPTVPRPEGAMHRLTPVALHLPAARMPPGARARDPPRPA